jgi:hypothetical protein
MPYAELLKQPALFAKAAFAASFRPPQLAS